MQTYSHLILTAALNQRYRERPATEQPVEINTPALLIGSFLPDVPLFILSALFFVQYQGSGQSFSDLMQLYDDYYFNHPVWIIGHSLFHSPLLLITYGLVGYVFGLKRGKRWGKLLFWLAVGCGFHSFIDILTHHHDGPLLLFPFDWQFRFQSPISYWDGDYFGWLFAPLEHLLDGMLLLYLGRAWWRRRQTQTDSI